MSENSSSTILVIGTFDTKNDELFYLSDCIQKQNGNVLTMDVSVLGNPEKECDISKHDIAKAANSGTGKEAQRLLGDTAATEQLVRTLKVSAYDRELSHKIMRHHKVLMDAEESKEGKKT